MGNAGERGPVKVGMFELTVMTLLLSSLVRLGTSLYIPALPVMGVELRMNANALTFTMTVYWAIFALAALVVGPVSDAHGRRAVILWSTFAFLLGSLVCTFSLTGRQFIAGRVLQGIGGSALPVVGLAMARDACDNRQLIQVLGWMGTLAGLVPVLAPVLGGFIADHAGWRMNFVLLSVTTAAVLVYALFQLRETLAKDRRQVLRIGSTLSAYAGMCLSSRFTLVQLPVILCFCIQGLYLAVAPFLFVQDLHLSSGQFGLTNLVIVAALVVGRSLCQQLMKWTTAYRAFIISAAFPLAGGCGMLVLWLSGRASVSLLLVPGFLFGVGFGSMVPIGLQFIMTEFRHQSGAALALNNGLTLGASAVSCAIGGSLMTHGMPNMAILGSLTSVAGILIMLLAMRCRTVLV